ncbi:hypothetical protein SCP_1100890 [Sparassis crispa]|uniref:Uncharacterized protein n=1 Tax=Sparassis crispa TaxID=139825 RepID=A0A401GZ21_9APHY|nr:hypothetical protein SCP_1100890 [Sparassis crispa]GBE87413.1 hypothetical protein SCP_1100890 [Sparassis crispa]
MYLAREGDLILAEVWPLSEKSPTAQCLSVGTPLKGKGRPKVMSFSTGPVSVSTPWLGTRNCATS